MTDSLTAEGVNHVSLTRPGEHTTETDENIYGAIACVVGLGS